MPKIKNDKGLTFRDKRDLVIKTGLQKLPYVGSIFSLYYEMKKEKRIRRIESSLYGLNHKIIELKENEIREIRENLQSLDEIDREAIVFIIDEWFEKIETEIIYKKLEYLKQYFLNTLKSPAKENNFDERRFFLDALSQMTLLECDVLSDLFYRNELIQVKEIHREGMDQYAIVSSITRLKSYGFLSSSQIGITLDDLGADLDFNLKESVKITEYGMKFCEFCLKEN
jgi:hypothetical protein